MLFDVYIFILPAVFILLCYLLYLVWFCPNKIKIVASVCIILFLLRYVCIFIMLLAHKMTYLYMLKLPYFLNLPAGAILIFISFYIFMRKNNVNFNYIFLMSAVVAAVYMFEVLKYNVYVTGVDNFGYTMFFKYDIGIYWTYIIIATAGLFGSLVFLQMSYVNKIGFYMLAFACVFVIAENIGSIVGFRIFPESIIGDLVLVCTFIYALWKVKK